MIVRTRALVKRYGTRAALDGIDLAVSEGSVFGLVGPNGAGKTTLLAVLAGLRRPTAGEVRLAVPRARMALLPDTPEFDPWLTGREIVRLAERLSTGSDFGSRADEVLSHAGLAEAADRRVGGYSRGMLQRLGLAATVVAKPELLLLDEPASALDPAGRREVLDLISGLRGKATVIVSSHILADVQEMCDAVGILRSGRLLFQGPIEQLLVGRAVPAYLVRLRPPVEPVVKALDVQDWVSGVEIRGVDLLRVTVTSLAAAERHLSEVLAGCGARVIGLAPQAADLEDVFLELTS